MKVIIGDDHSAIRKGVKNILNDQFAISKCDEASSVAQICNLLIAEKWDLLILDINLPGRGGFDVLKFIKDNQINVYVLVFSFHRDEQIAFRAIRSGANGYLTKDSADNELILAIQTILKNKTYLSDWVTQHLLTEMNMNEFPMGHSTLSNREYEVLILLAKGNSIKNIAQELFLSNSAVSTYRKRILEKLNFSNNSELIRYCIDNKLI